MIFKKPEPAPNGDNGKPQLKSKFQMLIYHSGAIQKHIAEMQNLINIFSFDLQKGSDYFRQLDANIIAAVEEAGGTIEPGSIEQAIADYAPRAIREREDAPQ